MNKHEPNNRILVTGGAGFIGSHLCERLAADPKNDVYSLDNYFTGKSANEVNNVTYITGSVKNISNIIEFRPDIIYHLGEYSRVEQSFDDIDKVLEFNHLGISAILEFVRECNCKIVYSGSSTKFGDNHTDGGASPYAWSKAANVQLVKNYGKWFGINYAITYFYNVYGPREIQDGKYSTLLGIYQRQFREGLPLTVVKPGTQLRNFTHVEDIISGLILVGQKGEGDGFGIGSPTAYSVHDIASMFGVPVKMLPERRGNRMTATLNSDPTIALGWKPEHEVTDYIKSLKRVSF